MQRFLQSLWYYARITLVSMGAGAVLAVVYALLRGWRATCEFSNAFFYGAVLVILGGGVVALMGGRGQSEAAGQRGVRRSLREKTREEREAERKQRQQEREKAMSLGIAVASAAFPLLIVAWRLCPA